MLQRWAALVLRAAWHSSGLLHYSLSSQAPSRACRGQTAPPRPRARSPIGRKVKQRISATQTFKLCVKQRLGVEYPPSSSFRGADRSPGKTITLRCTQGPGIPQEPGLYLSEEAPSSAIFSRTSFSERDRKSAM
jgi:hypothetical protein